MNPEQWHIAAMVLFACALVLLVVAALVFWRCDIRAVHGVLSGRTAEREIARLRRIRHELWRLDADTDTEGRGGGSDTPQSECENGAVPWQHADVAPVGIGDELSESPTVVRTTRDVGKVENMSLRGNDGDVHEDEAFTIIADSEMADESRTVIAADESRTVIRFSGDAGRSGGTVGHGGKQ